MKRKYCLVRHGGDLDCNSFVYVVWVGSSLRESMALALVEEYCKDIGWYFKRWSPAVDSALKIRTKLIRLDGNWSCSPYQMIDLSIKDCYQTIIDDSWAAIESRRTMTPQETRMRFGHTPRYLLNFHRKSCVTSCPPSGRKYLSHGKSRAFYELTPYVAGIVLLIVLDGLVSHFFL